MPANRKILVTGGTGTIARPVVEHLARDNEVWCAGRFGDAAAKAELQAMGVRTCMWDMDAEDWSQLPADFTHVFHAAMDFGPALAEHDRAIRLAAEATGLLMQHCRTAEAFVFVSTFCVYRRQGMAADHPYAETDPLGCDVSYSASYPMSKIAAEGAVRAAARMLGLRTTIARMNVGYGGMGGNGGLPVTYYRMMAAGQPIAVSAGADELCSPIAARDIARQSDALFGMASVPATIVNWAGDETVSRRELCEYIGELTGVAPVFVESPAWIELYASDNRRRRTLMGDCTVRWRDGVRELFATRRDILAA